MPPRYAILPELLAATLRYFDAIAAALTAALLTLFTLQAAMRGIVLRYTSFTLSHVGAAAVQADDAAALDSAIVKVVDYALHATYYADAISRYAICCCRRALASALCYEASRRAARGASSAMPLLLQIYAITIFRCLRDIAACLRYVFILSSLFRCRRAFRHMIRLHAADYAAAILPPLPPSLRYIYALQRRHAVFAPIRYATMLLRFRRFDVDAYYFAMPLLRYADYYDAAA